MLPCPVPELTTAASGGSSPCSLIWIVSTLTHLFRDRCTPTQLFWFHLITVVILYLNPTKKHSIRYNSARNKVIIILLMFFSLYYEVFFVLLLKADLKKEKNWL